MSRRHYPAPPPHRTNPFVTAEPIYETGPLITQPRRNLSSPYSPRDNSDVRGDLDPFRNPQMIQTGPIPLAAPRPGYATNISALTLSHLSPVATPVGRFPGDTFGPGSPVIAVPQTPHPLQPPVTPIAPVFARPAKSPTIKFAPEQPIMRGEEEGALLPKRGERGDQFWKRFSIVAKTENNKPSAWLMKTSGRQSRFNLWVWVLAIFLVLAIAGLSVLGWYMTNEAAGHRNPVAVGGKGNEKPIPTTTSSVVVGNLGGTTRFHVSPTLTVAKRDPPPTGTTNITGHRTNRRHKRHHH